MWCNFGMMGGRMWWPHGFGGLFFLLLLAGIVYLVVSLWKKTGKAAQLKCPSCNGSVQAVYLRCPHCGAGLKRHCPHCAGIVEAGWRYCPTCEAEINKSSKTDINGSDRDV